MQVHDRYPNLKAPRIFEDLGFKIDTTTTILDFGCGAGSKVQAFRRFDVPAFGCDIRFKSKGNVRTTELQAQGYLRQIDLEPYKLPFDNDFFDLVFSDQVFEHVQNYDATLAEISRVMKPGGCSVHIFPSRYKLVESHVMVPLASVLRSTWWLRVWAALGVRNKFQTGQTAREVAERNRTYLDQSTNYLEKKAIRAHFESHFEQVSWREDLYLKHAKRSGAASRFLPRIPFLPELVSALKCRVVVAQKPR